jgi:hypothetical protein
LRQAQTDYGELQNALDAVETEREFAAQGKQAQEDVLQLQSSTHVSTEQVTTITDIVALQTTFVTLYSRCEAAEAKRANLLRTLSQQRAHNLSPEQTVVLMLHMSMRCQLFTGTRRLGHYPNFVT